MEVRIVISKRLLITITALCILIAGSVLAYKLLSQQRPAPANPFSAQVMASAQFPLYYPAQLPSGYHVDPTSVTEPHAGVVVFTAIGQKNEAKIYFSEEARPTEYDVGAFYSKFSGLQETGFSDGAIATGSTGNGGTKLASRLTSKTWIIANTNNQTISYGQLTSMMKGLTLSY